MTTRNPFTDYALPPISRPGGADSVVTTMAIGEEGGVGFWSPPVTTLAIGEESGSGPVVPTEGVSALAQVFHVSPQFRAIRLETRDLRSHPVLGGISSTRWNAWNGFTASNAALVSGLAERPALPLLRQLVVKSDSGIGPQPSLDVKVVPVVGSAAKLPAGGILSGDERANVLIGSEAADVLIGWGGGDRIIGRGGGDWLAGGGGGDRFLFDLDSSAPVAPQAADTITDFRGFTGDRLVIRGMSNYQGQLPFSRVAGEVRFSAGLLQADQDGDGQADLEIRMAGVTEMRAQWLSAGGP
ncbi:MAG: hypothetical protein VKI63_08000 [Cyanobium sp.]|nr:hypothetical protein [Cyanobium sp.]